MFISNLFTNFNLFICFIIGLAVTISIHESAHAWVAHKLGDDTAKQNGRITLNPLAHLDFMGTLFLLIIGFGWGKPVPVDYNQLSNPKKDGLLIALAGPLSNFIAAILFIIIFKFIPLNEFFGTLLYLIIQLNLVLMIFNLIPIPPLDGSNILIGILPDDINEVIRQYSTLLLIVFMIFALSTNYISDLINAISNFFFITVVGI